MNILPLPSAVLLRSLVYIYALWNLISLRIQWQESGLNSYQHLKLNEIITTSFYVPCFFLCYIVLIILKSFCLASARLRDSWFIFLSEVHTSKVQLFTSEVVLRSLILFLVRCWKVLGVLCKYFRFHGFWTFCRVNVQSRLRKSLWNLWIDANFLSPMWNIHTQLNSLVNATHLFAVIQTETLKKITKSLLQKTGNVYTYIICCAQAEPWEKNPLQQKL